MWEIAVHLDVAGGVYDGVFLGFFFLRDVLDGILIESVPEDFPTYSSKYQILEVFLLLWQTRKPLNLFKVYPDST